MAKKSDWIIGGVILLFIIIFFLTFISLLFISPEGDFVTSQDKVACVELYGPIFNSKDIVRQLKKYRKNKSIDAVVLRIESPGGAIGASQEIYDEVKKTRESGKITIASMGNVAASGGYYVACGADKIVANPGTITGSIGVIAEFFDITRLTDKLGLKFETIKSGKFKDSGSPYRTLTSEERKYFQKLIDDSFQQFVDVVHKERGIDKEELYKIADGRVFTGQQAKELNLVDELGNYEDAISLAIKMAGISEDAKIIKEKRRKFNIFDILFADIEEIIFRLRYNMIFGYLLK
ncbi:MAG: signal peptide peptidase SppA [Candidatus Helarchaeota archaeon]|nr:signal peptide peptidase SppA [Candidatus Helarchaeota archaeon]